MTRNLLSLVVAVCIGLTPSWTWADGKVMPPRNYTGSLEERSQEAIIIFHTGEGNTATEDLILKIQVEGDAEEFAWIVPFPNKPKIKKEDPALFRELFNYVQYRKRPRRKYGKGDGVKKSAALPAAGNQVTVLSRETVGNFDITVVQETAAGGLNPWLKKEGFQELKDADDVLDFYRQKNYVYACIKVNRKVIAKAQDKGKREETVPFPKRFRRRNGANSMVSHPLRFTFATGGTDGAYFPMKLTGLQKARFDVNLYVFYRYWLNDHVSQFGYEHRGFKLNYRDWDTNRCVPNGGKSYTAPRTDPFLKYAPQMPKLTTLLQKLYPGAKYYLTNIQARRLNPVDVREWSDDLWLFPYYSDPNAIPQDVLRDGPASAGWPNVTAPSTPPASQRDRPHNFMRIAVIVPLAVAFGVFCGIGGYWFFRRQEADPIKGKMPG